MTYKWFCEQIKAHFVDIDLPKHFVRNEAEYRAYIGKIMFQATPHTSLNGIWIFMNGSFAGYLQ